MVESKFEIGDLIVVSGSQTSGIPNGEIGLVTSVEHVQRKHFIYWVQFTSCDYMIPMWSVEMEKIS